MHNCFLKVVMRGQRAHQCRPAVFLINGPDELCSVDIKNWNFLSVNMCER